MFSPGWESCLQALLNLFYTLFPTSPPFFFCRCWISAWIRKAFFFNCFSFRQRQQTIKAIKHKATINKVFTKDVVYNVDTCPKGLRLSNPSWRLFSISEQTILSTFSKTLPDILGSDILKSLQEGLDNLNPLGHVSTLLTTSFVNTLLIVANNWKKQLWVFKCLVSTFKKRKM